MKTKQELLKRYFQLENRIEILNRISQCIWINDWIKRRRLNQLMFVTKLKFKLLDNILQTKMNRSEIPNS